MNNLHGEWYLIVLTHIEQLWILMNEFNCNDEKVGV